MNRAARLARVEAVLTTRHQIVDLYARIGLEPGVDPATIIDPAHRAGVVMIRTLSGQPGGPVLLDRFFDAVADFGREAL
jgi:hypothetical protein